MIDNSSTLSSLETRLPVTPLGRGVALVRVTDLPTVMMKEGEGERRMEAGTTGIERFYQLATNGKFLPMQCTGWRRSYHRCSAYKTPQNLGENA